MSLGFDKGFRQPGSRSVALSVPSAAGHIYFASKHCI
jgi:hypothetical protein